MIKFQKAHGAGNDFIVVADPREDYDWKALAKRLCVRQTGIGADGLIVSKRCAALKYKISCYNPDGSIAAMCGNGLRCAARCVSDDYGDLEMILVMERIEHQAIIRGPQVAVTAEVGVVTENSVEVMRAGHPLRFSSVNTGIQHAVALSEFIDRVNVAEIGRMVRYHPALAPAGANVSVAETLGCHLLRIRTYERGVEAETLSCGSGAVAAVVIARLAGSVSAGPVVVLNQAGTPLVVDCPDDPREQTIWLSGPAEVTYRGDLL